MSKSGLFAHFGSKEEVQLKLLDIRIFDDEKWAFAYSSSLHTSRRR
jgi:hypothetical protein